MKIFNILVTLVLLNLTACKTLDSAMSTRGIINSEISKMDGRRIITMSPVLSKHGLTDIQAEFGLYWEDKKGKNAFLVVEIDGARNFDPKKPFHVKVDGELIVLPPVRKHDYGDTKTIRDAYVTAYNKSSKDFLINKNQILKIANAKEAFYRIFFLKNSYADGEITYDYQDYQSYIPYSFRMFHNRAWK